MSMTSRTFGVLPYKPSAQSLRVRRFPQIALQRLELQTNERQWAYGIELMGAHCITLSYGNVAERLLADLVEDGLCRRVGDDVELG